MKNILKFLLIISSLISLSSCISYKPILDQNDKYFEVGEDGAKKDIDSCTQRAEVYLKEVKKDRAVREGVRGAGWGSIFGGIFGFLIGGDVKGLVTGVAVGTGVGAASGAGGVIAEDNLKPDQIKQRYVTNCLGRKGYEVIGWE